jgi:hypothetical protein
MNSMRNVIVHSCFHDAQFGMNVDHITSWGKKWRVDEPSGDYISYEDFERLFERQNEIIDRLAKLHGTITPISSFSRHFVAAVEEIIDSSPNVIRFHPRRPQMDE